MQDDAAPALPSMVHALEESQDTVELRAPRVQHKLGGGQASDGPGVHAGCLSVAAGGRKRGLVGGMVVVRR